MLLTASLPQYGGVPPPCVSVGDVTASERVCVSPSFACLCTCPAQVHPALTPPTVPTRTRRGHPVTGVCPGICLHVPAAFLHRHQLDPRGRHVQLGHAPQPKRRGRDPVLPNPRGGYHYLLWGPSQALLKPGGCQRGDPTLGPAQPGSCRQSSHPARRPCVTCPHRIVPSLPALCPGHASALAPCPAPLLVLRHPGCGPTVDPLYLAVLTAQNAHAITSSMRPALGEEPSRQLERPVKRPCGRSMWQESFVEQGGGLWLEKGKLRAGEGGVQAEVGRLLGGHGEE